MNSNLTQEILEALINVEKENETRIEMELIRHEREVHGLPNGILVDEDEWAIEYQVLDKEYNRLKTKRLLVIEKATYGGTHEL